MAIYPYQNKQGKFYGVRFRVTEDGLLVHKNLRGFKTQKEAKIAEFEYRKRAEENTIAQKKKAEGNPTYTLSDIWDMYFRWAVNNLSASSIYSYNNIYNNNIKPYFGLKDITKITKRDITIWQDSLDFGYKYKSNIKAVLSAIMTFALNRDYIQVNPVQNAERIRNTEQKKKIEYWTKEEFDRFIEVVDDQKYKAFFTFLYVSGCRKGEAFALRWSDVDIARSSVSITKSTTKKGEILSASIGLKKADKTKNKKSGEIILPTTTTALLDALPRGEYVFGCNKPLSETSVARDFNRYIELAGVKHIRVHDLRHSCAALIISSVPNAGIDVLYAVAEHLRDTPEQVLKTYGHLFPSRHAEIINNFNALFV